MLDTFADDLITNQLFTLNDNKPVFGEEPNDVLTPTLQTSLDILQVLGFADAYAIEEFDMNGGKQRFMHHGETPAVVDQQSDDAQPEGDQATPEAEAPIKIEATDLGAATVDARVQATITESTELLEQSNADEGNSSMVGSAVILSLAGWRRKKEVEQDRRNAMRAIEANGFRVLVEPEDYNTQAESSRMAFDPISGRLVATKVG